LVLLNQLTSLGESSRNALLVNLTEFINVVDKFIVLNCFTRHTYYNVSFQNNWLFGKISWIIHPNI